MKRLVAIGLLFLFSLIFLPLRGETADPDLLWRTIRTEHFNIYYYQGLEGTARLAASLCEEIHDDLSVMFGWEVKSKTEVVITDDTDGANGSASVMGKPVMHLFATAPTPDSELQTYDHWLRSLIVHEYTHVVHLSIRGRVAEVVNSVFGDIYMPNQLAPRWLIEGIAVLIETDQTAGGRIRSTQYKMFIRADALQGRLQRLGQLSNDTMDYLRGAKQYLYGAMFMDYVRNKYGLDKIVALCHRYGDSLIPYGLNRLFLETFGQDLVSLYDEWIAYVKTEAESMQKRLGQAGITASDPLTFDGETKGRPLFAPDDESLIMPMSNGEVETGAYRISRDGAKPVQLFRTSIVNHMTMDRSGRIYYTRPAPFKNVYRFHDVFTVVPGVSEPRRLTFGMRALYAAISPRGDRLAVVVNNAGTSKMLLADEKGNPLRTLVDSKPGDQVYEPVWSPDGKQIVAIIRHGIQMDLALVDPESGAVRFLTDDRSLEQSPVFDPTGRYIVFSSDRSGVDNLYAFDRSTGRLLQISNVVSGAYAPAISHDGRSLAFLKYSTFGYDLHEMPFKPEAAAEAEPVTGQWPAAKDDPAPSTAKSERFNPFPTMVPTYWMLNTFLDAAWNVTLQGVVAFSDITGRHHIGTDLNYNIDGKMLSGQVGYSYQGLGPALRMGVSRQAVPRKDGFVTGGVNHDWMQMVTRGNIGLGFPIPGVDDSHGLTVGYNIVHSKPREEPHIELDPRGALPTVPKQSLRAGFTFGWSYGDVVSSPFGIIPHKGRTISANIGFYHPMLGGDQILATISYGWNEYIGMPWLNTHVLVLSLSGAAYISNPPNTAGFTVGGYNEQNVVDAIINGNSAGSPSLRGYLPGAFSGSHYQNFREAYRFPIWTPEVAYATVPLFLKRIQCALFNDNVIISYADLNRKDWRTALGFEIVWTFLFGYYAPITLRTGYAHGFMKGGTHEVILLVDGGF